MAYCPNCGASVVGRFCAKCGTPFEGAAAGPVPQGPSAPQPPRAQYQVPAQSGGLTENAAGALCYLGWVLTGVIFLVAAPYNQSKFVRFHAFQSIFFSLTVFVARLVLGLILTIFVFVLAKVLPFGFLIFTLVRWIQRIFWLGSLAVWVFLMYKAYNKEKFVLPLIGPLAEKQA